jgi:hypothetical protein
VEPIKLIQQPSAGYDNSISKLVRPGNPVASVPTASVDCAFKPSQTRSESSGAPDDRIVLGIQELPPSQAMEMGKIMPDVAEQ